MIKIYRKARSNKSFAILLFISACAVNFGVYAATPPQFEVPSAGAMQSIPGAHELPDASLTYKLVFNVQTLADSSDDASPALGFIGTIINTLHVNGVPADHIKVTAVFHGKSIVLVTTDKVYHERTGSPSNPNDKLLKELSAAGVNLVVCGQSARSQHFANADLSPLAKVNLSATITFINLQTRGYVKIDD